MCGRGDQGQLGTGRVENETAPIFIKRITDKIQEVACGEEHTLVLTTLGEIYTMGSNSRG